MKSKSGKHTNPSTQQPVSNSMEAFYASIITSSDDAIISKTLDGIITSWNPAATAIFGYTAHEAVGKHITMLIPGYLWHEEAIIIEQVKADKYVRHFETERIRKDGTTIYISLTVSPIKNKDGEIIGASKIARDISEEKQNEKRLRETLREVSAYKYALDESAIVAITDANGRLLHVNDNFCRISKYSRNELLGKDYSLINSGYHTREFMADLWQTIKAGKIWRGELKNKAKDGAFYWVDCTIIPFKDEEDKPYQFVSIRTDITQRKNAEEAFMKSEVRYKSLIDQASDGIFISDEDRNYLDINIAGCELLGYTKEEMLQMNAAQHSDEEDNKSWPERKSVLDGGKVLFSERKMKRKDGSWIYVEVSVKKLPDNKIIGILRDISERKKAEKEILELNESLELKVLERTSELQDAVKELESFSYSVSHDLRAPLRAINGYANILEEDYAPQLDNEAKRLLSVVQANAKKMGVLIDDLLAFSRLGRKEINKTTVCVQELVQHVIDDINKSFTNHAVFIVKKLPDAQADYNLLTQVFTNLISNAVKYSSKKENPVVTIDSEKEKNSIIYSVADNGAGFDMQYAHKLFGIFQRLHSNEEFEGTGVGLALVQRIVHRHGGKVWASSTIGEGAVFKFSLPI